MTIYTDVNDNYLAVQVTLENMESVARWCKGEFKTKYHHVDSKYQFGNSIPELTTSKYYFIELIKAYDRYEALVGDWIVLRMGKAGKPYFDVYSNEDFLDLYREV